MKKLFLIMLLSSLSFSVIAAEKPKSSVFDQRVQYVEYNPDQVVLIKAKVGHVAMVQLSPNERIEGDASGIAVGDAEAWNIAVKGNNIFFKPIASSPQTNLIITSNLRTYIFGLSLANNKQSPTYILRFKYPEIEAKIKKDQRDVSFNAKKLFQKYKNTESVLNKNYWAKGNKSLAPQEAWDDGRFTYFKYPNAKELPAIFKILPDGTESLVNTHIEKDTIIVHELANKFILRLGKSALSIENKNFDSEGQYNEKATSDQNLIRLIKHNQKGDKK